MLTNGTVDFTREAVRDWADFIDVNMAHIHPREGKYPTRLITFIPLISCPEWALLALEWLAKRQARVSPAILDFEGLNCIEGVSGGTQ
eukprot:6173693-Pleurochrysis_carterae.AAC.1